MAVYGAGREIFIIGGEGLVVQGFPSHVVVAWMARSEVSFEVASGACYIPTCQTVARILKGSSLHIIEYWASVMGKDLYGTVCEEDTRQLYMWFFGPAQDYVYTV